MALPKPKALNLTPLFEIKIIDLRIESLALSRQNVVKP